MLLIVVGCTISNFRLNGGLGGSDPCWAKQKEKSKEAFKMIGIDDVSGCGSLASAQKSRVWNEVSFCY